MNLTHEEVDKFLVNYGKRGERTMHILGKLQDFMKAKDTDFGKEFLSDMILEHDILLDKIASLEATEAEKADYRAVRKALLKYSAKIASYYEAINVIKQST